MFLRFNHILICSVVVACISMPAVATAPTKDELAQCRLWARNNFSQIRTVASSGQSTKRKTGLVVVTNLGPVVRNRGYDGKPMKIGNVEFKRGIACRTANYSASRVKVVLPGPAKSFTATIGVDAYAGDGSVVFGVSAGGKALFTSGVTKQSDPCVSITVDLAGASEFTLRASDIGDKIVWNQIDWADARVTLVDGTEIWLSDMPEVTPELVFREMATPPFSFVYGGKCSDELIGNWKYTESTNKLDKNRTQKIQKYFDPKTGLEMRVVMVQYGDYPTFEWTIYFTNTGKSDTPILENIRAIDITLKHAKDGEFVLHHGVGGVGYENDYQPLEDVLKPNAKRHLTTSNGRSTNQDLCYFNIEMPGKQGVIIGLGWPGQWASDFVRDAGTSLRIAGGQEFAHFKLHPGETVRTPLVVLQFWQGGDWIRAQNIWRRWMIAHNMPHPGGKEMKPEFGGCCGSLWPSASEELSMINGITRDGVKLDHWILDSNWYVRDAGQMWEADKKRFPNGLNEVADCVHKVGGRFVVWFEAERVDGVWLTENHPEWILGGKDNSRHLSNLGNPNARKWITDRIDSILTSERIDNYRSDYNIDPLSYWIDNDIYDREGITENFYVQGFLAFWDELLRRHPNMYIDTCASGGRRNDLETLRRAVPLLRSDWAVSVFSIDGAIGQQCQTYGISYWIPFHGTGAPNGDLYVMRSSYTPAYRLGYDSTDPNRNIKMYRQASGEIRQIDPYILSDFYPMTEYNVDASAWIAWQYNSPEKGGGAVQAFRRDKSSVASMKLKLRGLDPTADYQVTNLDGNDVQTLSGRSLLYDGLQIAIPGAPGSAVIIYKKAAFVSSSKK